MRFTKKTAVLLAAGFAAGRMIRARKGKPFIGMGATKRKRIGNHFNPGEVLKQLGGNRFIMMTGAKQFATDGKKMIRFKIGRNSKSVNLVRITLNSLDTYDMEFMRVTKNGVKVLSTANNIYNDQLQEIFTQHTGLYTRL